MFSIKDKSRFSFTYNCKSFTETSCPIPLKTVQKFPSGINKSILVVFHNQCKFIKEGLVAGNRTFDDYDLLSAWLNALRIFYREIVIISGIAPSVDSLAEMYAEHNEIPVKRYPADWDRYGKSAGPIRNQQMCEVGDVLH